MKKAIQVGLLVCAWALLSWVARGLPYAPPALLDKTVLTQLSAPFRLPKKKLPVHDDLLASRAGAAEVASLLSVPASPSAVGSSQAQEAAPGSWPGFLQKLRELESGQREKVRISHWGDSELVADGTSASLRRSMAARFGWGGLGFSLPMLPLQWYQHEGWRHRRADGSVSVKGYPFGKLASGIYGPGGVAFEAAPGTRAHASVTHAKPQPCTVTFFFAKRPAGGELELSFDGVGVAKIDTAAEVPKAAEWRKHVDVCPSELRLQTKAGATLTHGWNIEYDTPGIVWSSLGVVSAQLAHLRYIPDEQLRIALASLQPDLLMLTFGLNIAAREWAPKQDYGDAYTASLKRIRAAAPQAACLVTGPYPFGRPDRAGGPNVGPGRAVGDFQKQAAEAAGCVFLDRFRLAGGASAALRWGTMRPKLLARDYKHLTIEGGERMGKALAQVILATLDGDAQAGSRFSMDDKPAGSAK